MAILRDTKGNIYEIEFYDIQKFAEKMVSSVSKSETLNLDYDINFAEKISKLSPEFEFIIHRLGWMLYDPHCLDDEEYLFSNGNRCYMAGKELIEKEDFDRLKIKNEEIGYPILTDSVLKYQRNLNQLDEVDEGILTEDGFVSVAAFGDMELLAKTLLMYKMINDKKLYLDFTSEETDELYDTVQEYLLSKPNVAIFERNKNDIIVARYSSVDDESIKTFLDRLVQENKVVVEEKEDFVVKGM